MDSLILTRTQVRVSIAKFDVAKFGSYHEGMCSHYQAIKERERYFRHFGVEPPVDIGKYDVWPGYAATFIRRPPEADVGDEAVPERGAMPGLFGLIPHWSTLNADGHDLMCQLHKPVDEKRMVVILPQDSYGHWLETTPEQSMEFMRPFPADQLQAGVEIPAQPSMPA